MAGGAGETTRPYRKGAKSKQEQNCIKLNKAGPSGWFKERSDGPDMPVATASVGFVAALLNPTYPNLYVLLCVPCALAVNAFAFLCPLR